MSATIRPMPRLGASALASLAVASLLLGVAACRPNGNVPTAAVDTMAPATGQPIASPTPVPETLPPAEQVETEWGPIWAEVPDGFPIPPGAQPAEADTTVSAAWTVPAAKRPATREVAQFYVDRFSYAGLGGGLDGPLEDGSYTAWASSGYGCDILVTAQPRGDDEAFATVLYGAGCPFSWLAIE